MAWNEEKKIYRKCLIIYCRLNISLCNAKQYAPQDTALYAHKGQISEQLGKVNLYRSEFGLQS